MMPNSLKYIALLSLTAVCHALMPKRGRNALLLAASWLFYLLSMPKYLPLLMVVTGATFLRPNGWRAIPTGSALP